MTRPQPGRQTRKAARESMRPISIVVGILLLIAIALGGFVVLKFVRLAGGLWGGQ